MVVRNWLGRRDFDWFLRPSTRCSIELDSMKTIHLSYFHRVISDTSQSCHHKTRVMSSGAKAREHSIFMIILGSEAICHGGSLRKHRQYMNTSSLGNPAMGCVNTGDRGSCTPDHKHVQYAATSHANPKMGNLYNFSRRFMETSRGQGRVCK